MIYTDFLKEFLHQESHINFFKSWMELLNVLKYCTWERERERERERESEGGGVVYYIKIVLRNENPSVSNPKESYNIRTSSMSFLSLGICKSCLKEDGWIWRTKCPFNTEYRFWVRNLKSALKLPVFTIECCIYM